LFLNYEKKQVKNAWELFTKSKKIESFMKIVSENLLTRFSKIASVKFFFIDEYFIEHSHKSVIDL